MSNADMGRTTQREYTNAPPGFALLVSLLHSCAAWRVYGVFAAPGALPANIFAEYP